MLVSVYDTLRSAGRELMLEPGVRESLEDAIGELLAETDALLPDGRRRSRSGTAARDALDLLQTTSLPERLIELPATTVRGARAAAFSDARKAVQRDRPRGARVARPGAPPGAAHRLRGRVRGSEGSRVGARLRGPAARARGAAAERTRRSGRSSSCDSARSWSTSSRTRTSCRRD